MKRKLISVAWLCCLLAACNSPLVSSDTEPGTDNAAFQTDRNLYTATIEDSGRAIRIDIQATFQNKSASPVFFRGCRPPHTSALEKWVDGSWVPAYAPAIDLCLSPPIQVAPGQKISVPSEIYACFPGNNCFPTIDFLPSGTFRLRQAIYQDAEGNGLLADEQLVSNSFTIKLDSVHLEDFE